MSSIELCESTV